MKPHKVILFVGSRFNVLERLLLLEERENIIILALKNSYLSKTLGEKNIDHIAFEGNNKKGFINQLKKIDFDILISNGCPYILPVNEFKRETIFLNIHPTYLPFLQGKTPINGIFYDDYDFYGATMHYIDQGIDTGDIIHQEKINISEDLDLGLLYYLSMKLEGAVFTKGWEKLKNNSYNYVGIKQTGKSTYFNRTKEMIEINFLGNDTATILKKIKSFGVQSQGCVTTINGKVLKIFDGEEITHQPLVNEFSLETPGSILVQYDNKLLIKTIDGIVKIKHFVEVTE